MSFGEKRNKSIGIESHTLEMVRGHWRERSRQGDVDPSRLKSFELFGSGHLGKRNPNAWETSRELPNETGQEGLHSRAEKPDPKLAQVAFSCLSHQMPCAFLACKDFRGFAQKRLAGGGNPHFAGGPPEQADAQFLLKIGYLTADGRLHGV